MLDCIKVLDLLVGEFTKSPNEVRLLLLSNAENSGIESEDQGICGVWEKGVEWGYFTS